MTTSKEMFSTFCLGASMEFCKTCQHEHNWETLNQLTNALRIPIQAEMRRMDQRFCQLTLGRLYQSVD